MDKMDYDDIYHNIYQQCFDFKVKALLDDEITYIKLMKREAMAEWLARLTWDIKVPGSIPGCVIQNHTYSQLTWGYSRPPIGPRWIT